jgi:hypothetical protein
MEAPLERPDADDILVVCANCGHIEDFHAEEKEGQDRWCLALNCHGCPGWAPKSTRAAI